MNSIDKVPSFELCKKLWDLGITRDINIERSWIMLGVDEYWSVVRTCSWLNVKGVVLGKSFFPSPDLSELGELLPDEFMLGKKAGSFFAFLQFGFDFEESDTEPNARAKLLIAL